VAINNVVDGPFHRSPSRALVRELRDQHANLRARLGGMLGSRALLEAIAGRSYWHPNGFAKLVLDRRWRVGEVRLHIWPEHPHDEDIHGHGWAYESIVLTGELTEIAYREAPPGEGEAMWRHSYRRVRGRQFSFRAAHPVHLRPIGGPSVHVVGDLSGGTHHHVHRLFASMTPAVTLLRVGRDVTWSSAVYRQTAEPPPIRIPRPTTIEDVRQWIGYVADLLDE
jgi:hypothetical protein